MPIYFFSKRAGEEVLNFIAGSLKLIYFWIVKKQSFKESLAVTFPSARSMILAIGRALKEKEGLEKFSYFRKLIKIILFKNSYLLARRSIFDA